MSRSRKAPAVQTAVIVRRTQGQHISRIARDLGMGRNTVKRIIKQTDLDQALLSGREHVARIVPLALDGIEAHVRKGNLTACLEVAKNTVFPLNQKPFKGADVELNVAIQNLIRPQDIENKPVIEVKPIQDA